MSAEGKIKINAATKEPETIVSPRLYLSDACFLAALQGETRLIGRLAAALQAPVWPIFLGRKSCPPAAPVFAGARRSPRSKRASTRVAPSTRRPAGPLRAAVEATAGQGVRRHDQIDTLSLRTYLPRFSRELQLDPPLAERKEMTSMYLSRLILNPRHRLVQRDLADCHQLHRTVMSAFPDVDTGANDARAALGVLYRVDYRRAVWPGESARAVARPAQWSQLPDRYLLDTAGDPENPP